MTKPPRRLYYMPGTCALAVHVALEWVGKPYEAINQPRDQLRSQDYLAINPLGVVPTLIQDGVVLVEAGAILLTLTDLEPDAALGPLVGHKDRAEFYRWIAFLSGTLHPHFWPWFSAARYAEPEEMHDAVRRAAALRVEGDFTMINEHLATRRWLVGETRTAADTLLLPMARWGLRLPKPTTAWPHLIAHFERISADPGVQAAMKAQGLLNSSG